MRALLLPCCLAVAMTTLAQEDRAITEADTTRILTWKERHKPGRATLYSAILPGAGQVYNRKYWKVPIVAAAFGVSTYFLIENTRQYNRYKNAYVALVDNDPNTVDEFNGEFSSAAVRDVADTYRRWLDMSYLAIGLVYVLNIVDATVDAHFVRFDVGEDLSLRLGPAIPMAAHGALGLTIGLQL